MNADWQATQWHRKIDADLPLPVTITRVHGLYWHGAKYKVTWRNHVLSYAGTWDFEVRPSARDRAWFDQHYFDGFTEAVRHAEAALSSLPNYRMGQIALGALSHE